MKKKTQMKGKQVVLKTPDVEQGGRKTVSGCKSEKKEGGEETLQRFRILPSNKRDKTKKKKGEKKDRGGDYGQLLKMQHVVGFGPSTETPTVGRLAI